MARMEYILLPCLPLSPPCSYQALSGFAIFVTTQCCCTNNGKPAAPSGCTHTRYTDRGHPHGHTPSVEHIMNPRGHGASHELTQTYSLHISRSRPPESPLGVAE